MTAPPPVELSLFEHLFVWFRGNVPELLDELHRDTILKTAKEALALYLRTGGNGLVWALRRYKRVPWWNRFPVVADLLQRWMADLAAGPDEVRWLGRDPAAGWQPMAAAQLFGTLPEKHLDHSELYRALSSLLQGIHAGVLDFNGERHMVRVFRRRARQPDDPGETPEPLAEKPAATAPVAAVDPPTAKRSRGPIPGTNNPIRRAREALVHDRLRGMKKPDERHGATVDRLAAEKGFKYPGRGGDRSEHDELVRVWRELDATEDK